MNDSEALVRDRRALGLFVVLAVALCALAYRPVLSGGRVDALNGMAGLFLMWAPGIAALLTSLIMYRSLRPLGLTGNRLAPLWVVGCIALPVLYTLLIKWGLSAVGMIKLSPGVFAPVLMLVGLLISLISAFGEELGWRGYASPVVTRVFGFWRGQTVLGLFWFLFHVPALLGTSYGSSPHPWFGNLMFLVSCLALSYFLGWVRQHSDSVWPSALFHASHNLYFLELFEPVELKHAWASFLIGEQGLLCALVQVALAGLTVWVWRRQARPL